jgi:hypothetical protein
MPAWVWVVIAVAVVAVVGLVVWQAVDKRRTSRLRERFGPEYDRTMDSAASRRDAESELRAREDRRRRLDVKPLSQAAYDRYTASWQAIQAQFVDDPRAAVAAADSLIQSVMADRGYPVEDFEQRAADVSVDHPQVVENYREGHRLAQASADGSDSTEDLRQAMRHYRALFDDLLEVDASEPTARERETGVADDERSTERTVR